MSAAVGSQRMLRVELHDSHGALLQSAQRRFNGVELGQGLDVAPLPGLTITIGRDFACDIVLDDAHSAALHAGISQDANGRLSVHDHGSVNGTWLDGKRVPPEGTIIGLAAQSSAETVHELVVGASHLRLRLQTSAQLAPEQPLPMGYVSKKRALASNAPPWLRKFGSARVLLATALLAIGIDTLLGWANQTSQRDPYVVLAGMLMSQLAGLAAWVAVWALVTRVAVGVSHWKTHATIAFGMSAALLIIDWLFDVGAFALSRLLPAALGWALLALLAITLIYLHSATALQSRQWRVLAGAALVPVLLLGMRYWQAFGTEQGRQSAQSQQVVLFPPVLRVAGVSPPSVLLGQARELKEAAKKSRDALQAEGDSAGDESSDDL